MGSRAGEGLPDVQSGHDPRGVPIQWVGVRDVQHPLRVQDAGIIQHTVATWGAYVGLPAESRGTHMSRLVDFVHTRRDPMSVMILSGWARAVCQSMPASSACLTCSFPYFQTKRAPVSHIESFMDYQVTCTGVCSQDHVQTTLTVVVPVTSVCPCSKALSERGAHNQRAQITVSVQWGADPTPLWIQDLIACAEPAGSSPLYGTLKRSDEQFVTEHAYDHPQLVEDIVRDVACALSRDPRVDRYAVSAENFESIHNHSAYAEVVSGTMLPARRTGHAPAPCGLPGSWLCR